MICSSCHSALRVQLSLLRAVYGFCCKRGIFVHYYIKISHDLGKKEQRSGTGRFAGASAPIACASCILCLRQNCCGAPHVPDVSQCCFLLDLVSWCCPGHVLTHICSWEPELLDTPMGALVCALCCPSAAHQARPVLLLQPELGWGWLLWGAPRVWGCFSSPASLRVSDRPMAAQEAPAWLCR